MFRNLFLSVVVKFNLSLLEIRAAHLYGAGNQHIIKNFYFFLQKKQNKKKKTPFFNTFSQIT